MASLFKESDTKDYSSGKFLDQDHAVFFRINAIKNEVSYDYSVASETGASCNFSQYLVQPDGGKLLSFESNDSSYYLNDMNLSIGENPVGNYPTNYLTKIDRFGDVVFNISFTQVAGSGLDAGLRNIKIVSDGYIVLGFGGDRYIGSTLYLSKGNDDVYLFKVSLSGEIKWVKHFGSSGADISYYKSYDVDSEGNIYFALDIGGTLETPLELIGVTPTGSSDVLIIKISPEGKVVNYLSINTVDLRRSPLVKVHNDEVILGLNILQSVEVGDFSESFGSDRRIYLMRFKL